ncbi:MAG: argininosuccinate synthase [Nitrososphaerales archaeon]
MTKVILAYSGGLDTSVAIKWLEEKYNARVVSVTVDVGQQENMAAIAEKAKKIGVDKHYNIDAKKEFVKDYIYPSIKANGLYEGKYPLSTALARPLIASKLVEIAHKENADAIAHGCTGKGNDQVRFDITIKALDPNLKIIAPVREWNLSREEEIQYAKEHGVPIEAKKSIFSIDQNLWGRSIESGPLEQPDFEPPEDAFEWVKPLSKTPDEPSYIEIRFEKGVPVSIDGSETDSVQMITALNEKAGLHGVGVIDHIEDRLVGIKSREVYECPAAICIIEAHKDLEKMVLTRHQLTFKELVDREWAWLVYTGLWVDPLRKNLDAFIDSTQKVVDGSVRLKLYKGGLRVVGRSARRSLYDVKLATYDKTSTFQQKAAEGFINLWGLPSTAAYKMFEEKKGGE